MQLGGGLAPEDDDIALPGGEEPPAGLEVHVPEE